MGMNPKVYWGSSKRRYEGREDGVREVVSLGTFLYTFSTVVWNPLLGESGNWGVRLWVPRSRHSDSTTLKTVTTSPELS